METPGPIHTNRHACTVGLKSLFKLINDQSPEAGEARKFFEHTRPSIQCKKVLTEKDVCWLCGGKFTSPDPSFKPNCEHVLPIAQGVIFLELYSSKSAGVITEAMQLEYEWAHAVCNQVKNATVLIKGESGSFEPDKTKITALLEAIRSKDVPIAEKQDESINKRLTKVTDYINRTPELMINTTELCPRKLIFKGGKTFNRKHNGRSIRKTTVRRNVATSRTYRKVRTSNRKCP